VTALEFSGKYADLAFVEGTCESVDPSTVEESYVIRSFPMSEIMEQQDLRLSQQGLLLEEIIATPHVVAIISDDQVLACGPIVVE
jgi:hypothetical protein